MKYHCLNCNYVTDHFIMTVLHSVYRFHTLYRDYSHFDKEEIKQCKK